MSERVWDLGDAIAFAAKAHNGQLYGTDPYILHPLRVMGTVQLLFGRTRAWLDSARMVAVLHDIIEDTDVDLPRGVPPEVAWSVSYLTRDKDRETYAEYIDRIIVAPDMVREVKIADLRDHLAHNPPGNLQDRYQLALARIVFAPTRAQTSESDATNRGGVETQQAGGGVKE